MAHTTSWQGLSDTFTAITEVFQSNEDPLNSYHKFHFKQDRSPQLYNIQEEISNVSINSNKRSKFCSHRENKLPPGESKELKAECKAVKTSKVLRQLQ